jgi:hypothetical protein
MRRRPGPLNGPTLEDDDHERLDRQRAAVLAAMRDRRWHTLFDLEVMTGHPQASISARLRDFRKRRYGSHTVDRRRIWEGSGTWEYRLRVNPRTWRRTAPPRSRASR